MRYIALGDLVLDCYYNNVNGKKELLKIDGGSSRFNVIANLATRGNKTAVISACGDNLLGNIAIHSLMRVGVDTSNIVKCGRKTRAYHLIVEGDRHISIKNCPICGTRTWYEDAIANTEYCISKIRPTDILILDGLKSENIPYLTRTSNRKVLDIGRIKRLENLSNKEILKAVKNNNVQILQLNETVEQYLLKRFFVNKMQDIFQLFRPELLIITRGKRGADILTQNNIFHKELLHFQKETDDTGAGDAFFSMFIQEYYNSGKNVNKKWVDSTFILANILTSQVVSKLGARGHLYDDYYLKDINNCICNN